MLTPATVSRSNLLIKDLMWLRSCSDLVFSSPSRKSLNLWKMTDLSARFVLPCYEVLLPEILSLQYNFALNAKVSLFSYFSFSGCGCKSTTDLNVSRSNHLPNSGYARLQSVLCWYVNSGLKPSTPYNLFIKFMLFFLVTIPSSVCY